MILRCEHLTKDYGGGKGLMDFSVTFRPGIYGILGPNGSGKSTLMNLLTDNTARTAGAVTLDGSDILKLGKDYRTLLGYMPQQQGFYPGFSPMAFLKYMAKLKGLSVSRRECVAMLEKVNLSSVQDVPLGTFSGGMCQRVLLAQALLGDPKILLLDEPTAGLDPWERIRIRNLISELSRDRIILIASHIVGDIESIADQVLILKSGHLKCMGTPDELQQSVVNHVREYPKQQLPTELPDHWRVGNIFRRSGEPWLRLVGEALPPNGRQPDHCNLEDVYLYYLEGME